MKKLTVTLIFLTMLATISGCSSQYSDNEGRSTVVTTTNSAVTTTVPTSTQAVTTTASAITTEATTTTTEITTKEVKTTTKAPSKPDVNITSTKKVDIVVNNENGIVTLNVEKVPQSPEFVMGTAIASATTVLNYYGFGCTKTELLEYIPIMKKANENGLWEDPDDYFLGDPNSYSIPAYCSSPVLKKAISSYLEENNISDYEVLDLSGSEFTALYEEIKAGNPVIIWVGVTTYYGNELPLKNGETFNYPQVNQCMVLTGYDSSGSVIVSDPLINIPESDKYLVSEIVGPYEMLGSQALVLHKSKL